jgi:hypothetical protein
MPTPAEIAAYVGAAAWLPHIASWAYQRFVSPILRIIPQRQVQLGFTTYGPIFNVRLSLSADQKDVIIEHMAVRLQHEHGEVHRFEWTGLQEMFSEITDEQGNRQLVERDQPAIALKVSTQLLLEKFVRFQDLTYHERHEERVAKVFAHQDFLKKGSPNYREETLQSKEAHDLMEFYKGEFWWKPGKCTATFSIQSSNRAKLRTASFSFERRSTMSMRCGTTLRS